MSAALLPESIRLARASWDAATPMSRVFLLTRSRYAARQGVPADEAGLMFLPWDELPPETCEALAWDVQFLWRVLRDGREALRAAVAVSEPLRVVK